MCRSVLSRLSLPQWKSGPVVHLGWTVTDELLCIQEDGSVLIYDMFGSFKRHFSMGQVGRPPDLTFPR